MHAPTFRRIHPLVAIAAVSLTLFSLLGVGAITGIITPAKSDRLEQANAIQSAAPADSAMPSVVTPKPRASSAAEAKAQPHAATPAERQRASSHTRLASRETSINETAKICAHCGHVAAIDMVKHDGEATGLGAVAGGVAGGVVGNQIGKGKGNVLMTILGAGGGAYAGNTIEKKVKSTTSYVVKVHMNDGSTRTVTMADKPSFAVGDEVKVINGGVSVVS